MKLSKEQAPKVGTIRTTEKGKKEVLINANLAEAQNKLSELKNLANRANVAIQDLKAVGLADSLESVILNMEQGRDCLITSLAAKMLDNGVTTDSYLANLAAERKLNDAIQKGHFANLSETGSLVKSYLLAQNKDFVQYKDGKVEIINEEKYLARFEIWATGEQAEKYLKIQETVKAFNSLIGDQIKTRSDLERLFNISDGLQIRPDWILAYVC